MMKKLLLFFAAVMVAGSMWAEDIAIATATFNGKNGVYTEGWTTTGTGATRADCIIIGAGENITSPEFNFSGYSKVTVEFKARRFGTLSDSKAVINVSIAGASVGIVEATSTNAANDAGSFTFTPTSSMTAATLVITCTNATSAGSTHGAGIGTITITGVVASSDPEIVTIETLNLAYDATSGEFAYSVNNPDGSTLTAAETTSATWISNVAVDAANKKVTFDAEANTGDARTATIRLTYGDITKDVTVNQAKFVQDYTTLPLTVAAGTSSADLKLTDGVSGSFDGSDYSNATHKVKFSKNTHYMIIKTNAQIGSCTFSFKGAAGAGNSTFEVLGSADGTTWASVEEFTITYAAKDEVVEYITTSAFAATDRYIKLAFKKLTGEVNTGLGKFTINAYEAPETVAISAAGYATYFNATKAKFVNAPAKAYIFKEEELAEIEDGIIPANTAVVLEGTTSASLLTVATDAAAPADNDLKGAATAMSAADMAAANADCGKFYALSLNAAGEVSSVGFYWINAEGAAFDIPAGKAYLALPATTEAAPRYLFNGTEEVTAVENVETADAVKFIENGTIYIRKNGQVYNVAGMLVK